MIKIILFLHVALTVVKSGKSEHKKSCYLADGCHWYKPKIKMEHRELFCDNFYAKFDRKKLENNSNRICMPNFVKLISFHINRNNYHANAILSNSFELLNMPKYFLKPFSDIFFSTRISVLFHNLKGIRADLLFPSDDLFGNYVIFNSDFSLYTKKNNLIKTCEDYQDSIGPIKRNLFWDSSFDFSPQLLLSSCRFRTPVCSLFFQNSRMVMIQISDMVK